MQVSTDEPTFATEAQQYAYDQSLANEENTGMMTAVFANLIILAILVIAAVMYSRKKARKSPE